MKLILGIILIDYSNIHYFSNIFFSFQYLLTFAYSVMVLSMGTLGVFTQADLTVTSSRWLPVAALAILVFGYGIAWGLPTIIMVEILNLEVC